jgi:hypothetical protein
MDPLPTDRCTITVVALKHRQGEPRLARPCVTVHVPSWDVNPSQLRRYVRGSRMLFLITNFYAMMSCILEYSTGSFHWLWSIYCNGGFQGLDIKVGHEYNDFHLVHRN